MRTQPCDAAIRRGRLRKAEQFKEQADQIRDLADQDTDCADSYVTLCVHAGIAASDVICCAALGHHAHGENHTEATALLSKADREAARHLAALLKMKTKAGYSHTSATIEEFKRAGRAAETLVEKARRAHAAT
ncbi:MULTISPECIES: hypothetical protein [unclassified Crossiella]|uniref:hypothetical protein n=1 Tax=unclassified Crossiella TaxID=2620835 RepID=UPI001FFF2FBD|nr:MULTISPECIES: hypothetical protein [unclassified Crossiella]MCK2244058.1 hypothetical protein [Crossiella sp. S99.2]MCK2257084.1 hypothetical protein [Crossiella sp. S99.1]